MTKLSAACTSRGVQLTMLVMPTAKELDVHREALTRIAGKPRANHHIAAKDDGINRLAGPITINTCFAEFRSLWMAVTERT
ncbi:MULTISPECIES: hypothetical protein [unclassified Sinorhizobium]|uniref:hypothetical protein n=1 Tax=unclassified Sinorhizobium TaxID=2613772 RepID=UPI0035262EB9